MMYRKGHTARTINAFGPARPGIRFDMPVVEGPAGMTGRTVRVYLLDSHLESVICYLMERPEWQGRRQFILSTAQELQAERDDPGTATGRRVTLGFSYFASTLQAELRKIRQKEG